MDDRLAAPRAGVGSWRRRPRLVVFSVVAALLLTTACTGDRVRPSDTLPPTSSTIASPSTTEDAPGATGYPLPEAARAYTAEGARAFFDYFIVVLNASRLMSDPEPLREITQGCEFCDELSQRIQEAADQDINLIGGELALTSVGDVSISPLSSGADGAAMAFIMIQRASQVFAVDGSLISDTGELELVGSVELSWLNDERDWLVGSFGLDLPS